MSDDVAAPPADDHRPAHGAHASAAEPGTARPSGVGGRRISVWHGWGSLAVVAVLVMAGVLFTANAKLAGGVDARQPQDLPGLVDAEANRAGVLQEEVDRLQAEVDELTDAVVEDLPADDAERAALTALAAGRVAVTGPGVTVQLWDAPADVPRPDWVTNDYLVVHQQDLQAVINSLWAGGAEAMTLQGERVITTSAFRCVGNVLRLHGQIYSPPYVVQAIGDPEQLLEALESSPEVQRYKDYVDAIGLGWSVDEESELALPAYAGGSGLRYADVLEEDE